MTEYQVTTHKGKKCTVRIYTPILTAEERKARDENTKKAIVRFYKETRVK